MSIFGEQAQQCPHCAHEFTAPAVRSRYEGGAVSLRQQVLSGQLQLYPCPACEQLVRVEPTMLYADIDRTQWYAVFPAAALIYRTDLSMMVRDLFHRHMEVFCPPEVAAWAPTLRKRLVFGLASLREKLICDDLGIDDRVLEVLKLQVLRDLAPQAFSPDTLIYVSDADDHRLIFVIEESFARDRAHSLERWAVDRGNYNSLAAERDLAERFPHLWDGWIVDWRAPLYPDERLPATEAVPDEMFERTY